MENLRIGVIGFGRVGSAFVREFIESGLNLRVIYDINTSKSLKALKYVEANTQNPPSTNLNDIRDCNFIIIAVQDDEIQNAGQMLMCNGNLSSGTSLVHTSGLKQTSILNAVKNKGINIGVMHPILSFPDSEEYYPSFKDSYFGISGDQGTIEILKDLVSHLKGKYILVNDSCRVLYHLAMVFDSNFVVALHSIATQILIKECDMDVKTASDCLCSLQSSVLNNLRRPGSTLSGPIVRGDFSTIQSHINALKTMDPVYLKIYSIMTDTIIDHVLELDKNENSEISEIQNLWQDLRK